LLVLLLVVSVPLVAVTVVVTIVLVLVEMVSLVLVKVPVALSPHHLGPMVPAIDPISALGMEHSCLPLQTFELTL
jgi:hypothetical protein